MSLIEPLLSFYEDGVGNKHFKKFDIPEPNRTAIKDS